MAQLRSPDFEAFPGEIRLKIYRLLLADDAGILDPTEWVDEMPLHTNILRCNKNIHDEAAAVLYGENCFEWDMRGDRNRKLWHRDGSAKTCVPRKYSRLITMVRLKVDFRGDDNDPSWQAVMNGFDQTKANLDHACELLTLNDLKVLAVVFHNTYTGGPDSYPLGGARFPGKPYAGEHCLLPLLKLRANRVRSLDASKISIFTWIK